MDSIEMRAMLDQHLFHNHPLMRLRLSQAGKLREFINGRVKEALETQRYLMNGVPKDDLNGRGMVNEVIRHQLLEVTSLDETQEIAARPPRRGRP